MKPLISVIIPFYRSSEYIRACMESVLCQTYTNLEIIAVDNLSEDGSRRIVEEFAAKDERIRVVSCDIPGSAAARNCGLAESTGEWIVWVDSDDILVPDGIELLYDVASAQSASAVMGGYYRLYSYGTADLDHDDKTYVGVESMVLRNKTDIQAFFAGNGRYFCFLWAKLMKRSAYEGVVFPEGKIYEDIAVMPRIMENVDCFATVDRPISYYVQHSDSLSHDPDIRHQKDGLLFREQNAKYYEEKYPTLVPLGYDGVIDFACYLLGRARRSRVPKSDPVWKELQGKVALYRPGSSRKRLLTTLAVWLVKVSPYGAGFAFDLYSKWKNHEK